MYHFSDNKLTFINFGQSVGMKMSPENRWVKMTELIPWDETEKRYAALFTNKKKKRGKSSSNGFGYTDYSDKIRIFG
jgi:hypothetical protein